MEESHPYDYCKCHNGGRMKDEERAVALGEHIFHWGNSCSDMSVKDYKSEKEKAVKQVLKAFQEVRRDENEACAEIVIDGINQHNPTSTIAQYLKGKALAIRSRMNQKGGRMIDQVEEYYREEKKPSPEYFIRGIYLWIGSRNDTTKSGLAVLTNLVDQLQESILTEYQSKMNQEKISSFSASSVADIQKERGSVMTYWVKLEDHKTAMQSKPKTVKSSKDKAKDAVIEAVRKMRRSQWAEGMLFNEGAYLVPKSDFEEAKNALSAYDKECEGM